MHVYKSSIYVLGQRQLSVQFTDQSVSLLYFRTRESARLYEVAEADLQSKNKVLAALQREYCEQQEVMERTRAENEEMRRLKREKEKEYELRERELQRIRDCLQELEQHKEERKQRDRDRDRELAMTKRELENCKLELSIVNDKLKEMETYASQREVLVSKLEQEKDQFRQSMKLLEITLEEVRTSAEEQQREDELQQNEILQRSEQIELQYTEAVHNIAILQQKISETESLLQDMQHKEDDLKKQHELLEAEKVNWNKERDEIISEKLAAVEDVKREMKQQRIEMEITKQQLDDKILQERILEEKIKFYERQFTEERQRDDLKESEREVEVSRLKEKLDKLRSQMENERQEWKERLSKLHENAEEKSERDLQSAMGIHQDEEGKTRVITELLELVKEKERELEENGRHFTELMEEVIVDTVYLYTVLNSLTLMLCYYNRWRGFKCWKRKREVSEVSWRFAVLVFNLKSNISIPNKHNRLYISFFLSFFFDAHLQKEFKALIVAEKNKRLQVCNIIFLPFESKN